MTNQIEKMVAFKLKGRLYTLTVMQLFNSNLEQFKKQLQATIQQAPLMFQQAPIVLDCTEIENESFDLQAICQCLREHAVFPVAVQGATPLISTLAQAAGLAILTRPAGESKALPKAIAATTKYHATHVRSGQQVVARGSDLLVMGSVSPGAEVLADGNIYIYGALRGRAIAGMSGNQDARICCQSLHAELVSVAGVYRLNEITESYQTPCQIFLKSERIVIEPICVSNI